MAEELRPLKVFLCHASGDKPAVRDLYKRLVAEGVDAWLDQEKLMPGQDWQLEIPRAVKEADVVVVCVSNKSVTKEGFIQKEIRFALDIAKEKPAGTIFLIPVRLEDCAVPEQLSRWQWVDLFEDNGFLKLLRSLKLRAEKIGAVIEPLSEESEDREIEIRLEQLYTDGLAAFYTEDWDRACKRFQAILRERPNHQNAAEKLAQSERQRSLAKLYAQATEAYESENWLVAIKALEDLLGRSGDYKDAVQLLKDARKQKQLKDLYTEAKALHRAEKWQAVVRVFEQISSVESAYPDPDGLLSFAQQQVAEIKRLEQLNGLYSHGLHEMDVGNWYEARRLLEQVHKAQTGFLETERLLRKVEHEITKLEELKKREVQVNTLYEQAHGLIRSKNWREALDKIEEIQRLNNQFEDKDGIAEKARAALELEEQEIQKQNQLAAMYAEAVRLFRESNYQEALDKLQEIKEIDPKYPDRQAVQRTARKKLIAWSPPILNFRQLGITILLGITVLVIIWFSAQSFKPPFVPSTFTSTNDSGITESPVPSALSQSFTEYYWDFDKGPDNWGNQLIDNDISFPVSVDGSLKFKSTGGNPYIHSPRNLQIIASETPVITIRMRVQGIGFIGAIYFVTDQDPIWDEKKKVTFLLKNSDVFETYDVLISNNSAWRDIITKFRLDPVDSPDPLIGEIQIEIDSISVHPR